MSINKNEKQQKNIINISLKTEPGTCNVVKREHRVGRYIDSWSVVLSFDYYC